MSTYNGSYILRVRRMYLWWVAGWLGLVF